MANEMTPLQLYSEEFNLIRKYIIETQGFSSQLTWVLKRDHGWSWRQAYWDSNVSIDFWSDSAKSMFLLKYSHLIAKSLKTLNKNTG